MPIYSCLKSMEDLKKSILQKSMEMMIQYQTKSQTHIDFLDMGLGYVLFAKEEKNLFRLLFKDSAEDPAEKNSRCSNAHEFGPLTAYAFESLLDRLGDSESLEGFTREEKENILYKAWIFSHGLAVLMNNGVISGLDSEDIVALMKETGRCLIEGARILKEREKPNE
jgi:hypothetical protein